MPLQVAKRTAKIDSSSPKKENPVSLDDVSKLLAESNYKRRPFCSVRYSDLILTTLFMSGIFLVFSLCVSSVVYENNAILEAEKKPIQLILNSNATSSQVQTFLQALTALPHVGKIDYLTRERQLSMAGEIDAESVDVMRNAGNPFTDRIDVVLSSKEVAPAFLGFLKSSELKSIFHPKYLLEIPAQWEETLANIKSHQFYSVLFSTFAVICILMALMTMFQFVRLRIKTMERQTRAFKLLGASSWLIWKPFIGEVAMIMFVALAVTGVSFSYIV
jgi:cell division protein FtsX